MKPELQHDLQILQARAYGIAFWAKPVLERYHESSIQFGNEDRNCFEKARSWLLVPLSLWPFSMTDVLAACLDTWEQTAQMSATQRMLIDLLPEPPDESTCAIAAAHEFQIQSGSYGDFVNAEGKHEEVENNLKANPLFQKQWQSIKQAFDVTARAEHSGVIRRSMMSERNLRPDWSVNLEDETSKFTAIFDAFCLRWNLYGMLNDQPLLLKLVVHLTPHGTMIHIPAYWSIDKQRDINWAAITKLHRARAKHRQGPSFAATTAQRKKDAIKLRELDAEVRLLNLRGDARHHFLCDGLGWVHATSPKRLQRLRNLSPE